MVVNKKKLFLRNRSLEKDPKNQRNSDFYKRVKQAIIKEGKIINPLLCVQEGDRYKICVGNNRYLAGLELGYEEFPILVLPNEDVITLRAEIKKYTDVSF
jgi:ParB-like chromosome segregation protein Spo0J